MKSLFYILAFLFIVGILIVAYKAANKAQFNASLHPSYIPRLNTMYNV